MSNTLKVVLSAAAATAIVLCSLVVLVDPAFAGSAATLPLDTGALFVANIVAGIAALPQTLNVLRERRAALVAKMTEMIQTAEGAEEGKGRELTAEEIAQYDAWKAEKVALDARIERAQDMETSAADLAQVRPAAARTGGVVERPKGPEAKREFESMGEFLYAAVFNRDDPRLTFVDNPAAYDENGELRAEFRMDNNTSGGFMIPPQLRTTIMKVDPQDALVRPRAQVIPPGSPPDGPVTMPALDQTGASPGNMFGGMTVSWVGEGGQKPETDAKLREITLTPHEVAGYVTVTDKLLRNWAAASAWIESLMRGAVNAAEDYAFLRGTGVSQPLGIINAGATKFINRAVALHVSYADLLNMVARLLMRGGQSPVWSMPQSALIDIATMTDPEGHYIWQANARDGFAGQLLGFPVKWNNRAPLLGTKGDIVLADWGYYLVKDGSGPFVAASEHVLFTQNKTVVKIFWNVDGAPWLTAPIAEENGYQVSPFIGLDIP